MTTFSKLINIDDDLRDLFKEIERHFSISLANEIIEKIFKDAEDDQVSEKEYLIFQGKKTLLGSQLIIRGKVDEYEPMDIWIEIKNIKEKDVKHFNEFRLIWVSRKRTQMLRSTNIPKLKL